MGITKLSKRCTVEQYLKYKQEKNKEEILNLFLDRYLERYIEPFKSTHRKHGFSMMAMSCLMIENFFCFQQGWSETPGGESNKIFENFFARSSRLKNFSEISFYKNIRCGILHQGETYNGWKIRRKGPLVDKDKRIINASVFIENIEVELRDYVIKMKSLSFCDIEWVNMIKKFDSICENSKKK